MPKKIQNTFDYSNIYTRIFAFLINLPKDSHFKHSNQLLYVSLGHLSPDLHQFQCKIKFCKILLFVKKNVTNTFDYGNFYTQIFTFLFNLPKKKTLSDVLLCASLGHQSLNLHQFQSIINQEVPALQVHPRCANTHICFGLTLGR